MTILPKKKVGKEKTTADPESHEHQVCLPCLTFSTSTESLPVQAFSG